MMAAMRWIGPLLTALMLSLVLASTSEALTCIPPSPWWFADADVKHAGLPPGLTVTAVGAGADERSLWVRNRTATAAYVVVDRARWDATAGFLVRLLDVPPDPIKAPLPTTMVAPSLGLVVDGRLVEVPLSVSFRENPQYDPNADGCRRLDDASVTISVAVAVAAGALGATMKMRARR